MYMPRFNADVQRPTPKEEAPMNTYQHRYPISETPKQPQQRQTAKDIIAANVKSLIEQLEAGHSDALTAYLDAMSRFHNYSFGNILEIARQSADRNPRCWTVRMEPARPEGQERRERAFGFLPRLSASSARRTRKPTRTSPSRTPASWLAFAMPTFLTWSRPKAQSFPPCGR